MDTHLLAVKTTRNSFFFSCGHICAPSVNESTRTGSTTYLPTLVLHGVHLVIREAVPNQRTATAFLRMGWIHGEPIVIVYMGELIRSCFGVHLGIQRGALHGVLSGNRVRAGKHSGDGGKTYYMLDRYSDFNANHSTQKDKRPIAPLAALILELVRRLTDCRLCLDAMHNRLLARPAYSHSSV